MKKLLLAVALISLVAPAATHAQDFTSELEVHRSVVIADGTTLSARADVVDEDDLPKVHIFGGYKSADALGNDNLRGFHVSVQANAPYYITAPVETEISRNGIGPFPADPLHFTYTEPSTSERFWWFRGVSGSSARQMVGIFPAPGTYTYSVLMPLPGTDTRVRYNAEFTVESYAVSSRVCSLDQRTVQLEIFVVSLTRLPHELWVNLGNQLYSGQVEQLRKEDAGYGKATITLPAAEYFRYSNFTIEIDPNFSTTVLTADKVFACNPGEGPSGKG